MSQVLVHVADRAVQWSVAADRLKARQSKARWIMFAMSIAAALATAIAGQLPTDQAEALHQAHDALAMLGAALLGLAALITNRFLGKDQTAAWVQARAASEALKREAFMFATGAGPYLGLDAGAANERLKLEQRRAEQSAEKLAQPATDPGRAGSSPREWLKPGDYRARRVLAQAQGYYRIRAAQHGRVAQLLKRAEFVLAVAATLMTAYAATSGKTSLGGGIHFDIAALTAVLTTVSGAILAHIESLRLEHLVNTYLAAARRLEDLDLDFDAAQATPAAWSAFVERCEDIISAENSSWVAKWSEEPAMRAKG